MKAISAFLLVGALLLTSACSTATVNGTELSAQSGTSQPETSDTIVSSQASDNGRQSRVRTDENSITGKIVSVTEKEITLTLAVSNRSAGGSKAQGDSNDASQSKPDRPAGDSSGSRPDGGNRQGPGGRAPMDFTGETQSYTLSDTVTIQNGMGEGAQTVELAALAVDNIVRVVLDENKQIVSITLVPLGIDGNQPPQGDSSTAQN